MKIIEKEHCYILEGFFSESVVAGFAKPSLEGDPKQDIEKALSFIPGTKNIAYLKQIHSATLHQIHDPGCYQGDGLFTKRNDLVLVVRTADCLPLFFYSELQGIAGVVHMGWKGAYAGILENVRQCIGAKDLSSFKVIAGVGLRKCCYKIGAEFLDYPGIKESVIKTNQELFFDPIHFLKKKMLAQGLNEQNIIDINICSACSPEMYYSYRRDATTYRTLSFLEKIQ